MNEEIITHSEAETEEWGQEVGRALRSGDVVALVGNLGAGKTCLARGIARGMGIREPVTSPTFILIAEYHAPNGLQLYHVDCYRLGPDAEAEAADIGLEDALGGPGVCVVEWAERIEGLLPPNCLRIDLDSPRQGVRRLRLKATGPFASRLLHAPQDAPENC